MQKTTFSTITNDEYKTMNSFLITYGKAKTSFGDCLIGIHENKVCYISFFDNKTPSLADLKKVFPKAELVENDDEIKKFAENIFEKEKKDVQVLVKGTKFETDVWKELVNLKKGSTSSYEDVAKAMNNPKAIRAVARAVAKNNISYLIPCHRVISKSGGLSKYKWGGHRKVTMLKHENAI